MVALPLFKLGALFVRHISKYGANRIKVRAHEHPDFRKFAARYGQAIHQLNMRMSVALLRNADAEKRAREAAEAPTVKTKEQVEREEQKAAQAGSASNTTTTIGSTISSGTSFLGTSPWRRKFRPLPEAKAVDLFADVAGDSFILFIAAALVLFEYYRGAGKPDANAERLRELSAQVDALRADALHRDVRLEHRLRVVEAALRSHQDPKTKLPLLPLRTPMPPAPAETAAAETVPSVGETPMTA